MPLLPGKPPAPAEHRVFAIKRACGKSTYDKNESPFPGLTLQKTSSNDPAASSSKSGDRQPVRRVALAGFGTVGRAVAKILCERSPGLIRLTHICNRNIERKKQPWVPSDVIWTEDLGAILNSEVDIIIELIGGLTTAEELVRSALNAGKSVVTANKQLHRPARPGFASARRREQLPPGDLAPSVAGGVPVLPALRTGLSGGSTARHSRYSQWHL